MLFRSEQEALIESFSFNVQDLHWLVYCALSGHTHADLPELDQRFGMAPNQETNTKLVSDVLSDALTRVFEDPSVGRLLGE